MILPTKHISLTNSLLNVGAIILVNIDNKHTVSSLWEKVKSLPEVITYERFTLALDLLFMLEAIEIHNGIVEKVNK